MNWVAPSEKDNATETLNNRLRAADQFRANSGLIFRRFSVAPFDHMCSAENQCAATGGDFPNLRPPPCDLLLPRLLSGQVALKTEAA